MMNLPPVDPSALQGAQTHPEAVVAAVGSEVRRRRPWLTWALGLATIAGASTLVYLGLGKLEQVNSGETVASNPESGSGSGSESGEETSGSGTGAWFDLETETGEEAGEDKSLESEASVFIKKLDNYLDQIKGLVEKLDVSILDEQGNETNTALKELTSLLAKINEELKELGISCSFVKGKQILNIKDCTNKATTEDLETLRQNAQTIEAIIDELKESNQMKKIIRLRSRKNRLCKNRDNSKKITRCQPFKNWAEYDIARYKMLARVSGQTRARLEVSLGQAE